MSDDLKQRLLDWSEYDEGKINDARQEAADYIEQLERERDEYFGFFVHWRKEADRLNEQLKTSEAKNGSMSNFGSYELNWRRKNE